MENQKLMGTNLIRTLAIWLILISVGTFVANVGFNMLAIMGTEIGVLIFAISFSRLQKGLIGEIVKMDRLLSAIVGVGVGLASFQTMALFNLPFSLPTVSLSGFVAGFTFYNLTCGTLEKTGLINVIIVGFGTVLVVNVITSLDFIIRVYSFAFGNEFALIFTSLLALPSAALPAILVGSISSIAGFLVTKLNRKIISAGILAFAASTSIAVLAAQYIFGPVFGINYLAGMGFSIELIISLIPFFLAYGTIVTCFLTIFQNKDLLDKFNFRENLGSIWRGVNWFIDVLPRWTKILVGCGILIWVGSIIITSTSNAFVFVSIYGIFSAAIIAGAVVISLSFFKNPTTEKGIFLFGFVLAAINAFSFFTAASSIYTTPYTLEFYIRAIVSYLLFSLFMFLWFSSEKIRTFAQYRFYQPLPKAEIADVQPATTTSDEKLAEELDEPGQKG